MATAVGVMFGLTAGLLACTWLLVWWRRSLQACFGIIAGKDQLIVAQAERIHAQSELLGKRAEKPAEITDGEE